MKMKNLSNQEQMDFSYKGFSKEKLYLTISQILELLDMFQHVQDKANKDFMSGTYNRRYFFEGGGRKLV